MSNIEFLVCTGAIEDNRYIKYRSYIVDITDIESCRNFREF